MYQRRLAQEAVDSSTSVPPVLACMAGLSTPPYLLFNMIGFAILHVSRVGARLCEFVHECVGLRSCVHSSLRACHTDQCPCTFFWGSSLLFATCKRSTLD